MVLLTVVVVADDTLNVLVLDTEEEEEVLETARAYILPLDTVNGRKTVVEGK